MFEQENELFDRVYKYNNMDREARDFCLVLLTKSIAFENKYIVTMNFKKDNGIVNYKGVVFSDGKNTIVEGSLAKIGNSYWVSTKIYLHTGKVYKTQDIFTYYPDYDYFKRYSTDHEGKNSVEIVDSLNIDGIENQILKLKLEIL